MTDELGRIPPCDIDAEMCTVGAMLMYPDARVVGASMLKYTDFWRPSHRHIFNAILALDSRNVAVDHITVKDELSARKVLDESGGVEYLMALTTQVPSGKRIAHYAGIVKDKALRRRMIEIGGEIIDSAYDLPSARESADKATELVLGIDHGEEVGFKTMYEVLDKATKNMEANQNNGGKIMGPRLGLWKIDSLTHGLSPGFTIIAAGTGIGKTTMLLQIARQSTGLSGAMFELEMAGEQLAERMIIRESGIDSHRARTGLLGQDEWNSVVDAAATLNEISLYICDQPMDAGRMLGMAQRAKLQHKVDYILVDYMGLIEPPSAKKSDNRNLELGSIARSLQKVGRKLDIPIIAACQLSRKWQDRAEKRPTLRDLRDSGELEQHADRVIFIHDPNAPDVQREKSERLVEIELAKHRYGPIGLQEVTLEANLFTFKDLETRYEER